MRLVAALVSMLCAGSVSAGPRIVNGLFTFDYPSVGALLAGPTADRASLECSGTLIGCNTFLTAAHCVCDGVGGDCQPGRPGAPDPSRFFVFLQHAGMFGVSHVTVRADYVFPRADFAILQLSAPVTGIRPTALDLTARPADGDAGTIVGFGSSGGDDYGLKRAGAVVSAPCTPADPANPYLTCWNFESPLGPPGVDSDTCYGDSGGPLFLDFGCGPTLAGVTSGGTANVCAPPDHAFDADVFTYRADLAAAVGADLGAAACGTLPQAGEPGTEMVGFQGTLGSATPDALHAVDVAPGTARLRIALNAVDDGAANFDLYVRFGATPTTTTFDCAGTGSGEFASCDLDTPAAGTWYALVHRVAGAGPYQVTGTTFTTAPPGSGSDGRSCDDRNACTGGDVCTGGTCAGSPVADGTICDDRLACTQSDACHAGACRGTAAPLAGCRAPIAARASSLLLADDAADRRDKLTWTWRKGAATSLADLGDPTLATDYELCAFDTQAGVPVLLFDTRIPAGPAWTAVGGGFRYRDHGRAVAGIGRIALKAGTDGHAAIGVAAKAPGFFAPPLPLAGDPAVIVQLTNGAACWEARYGTSQVDTAARFQAKSD